MVRLGAAAVPSHNNYVININEMPINAVEHLPLIFHL